jgi:hypothetical protein
MVSVTAVSSSAEITETTLDASITRMNWLARAGNTVRSAGISTTKRKIWCERRPSARPASTWPGGTTSMPARTISVA